MIFKQSDGIKITLLKEQEEMLQTKDNIKKCIGYNTTLAFDIYDKDDLIGFVMLDRFDEGCYFLWDYAIDAKFQNKYYGTKSLIKLIKYMKDNFRMHTMTTTYIFGNTHAKHVYEKVGFIETDEINNEQTHEVNMILKITD
ncbi:MAG: GNAT family N-acetyltransferase [Oscillospiraceae bacterium]|nr:GNAT family N-acetyltransferase [Oscillospiraceae bacterium]